VARPRPWTPFAATLAALALLFAWYARIELRKYPLSPLEIVAIYLCLLLLFALYLAPGFPAPRRFLVTMLSGPLRVPLSAALATVLLLIPYLISCLGTGDFRPIALGKLAALAAVPLMLFAIAPVRDRGRLNWQDVIVLLWLMLPVLFGWIAGIFLRPVNLDFMTRVFLVAVGSWSFLIIRGIENSGYEFAFSFTILGDALINFALFSIIAIPLGRAMRFITWNPQWRGPGAFAFDYLTIFLFIAVTEELFFRGLIQNLLEGSLASRKAAQAITAVLFGFSHILHAPYPNWRYVILATIAGWFYGPAYRKHRSLMASATTHALVDTLWRTFFTIART
jgi:uncharacterized protein